MFFDSGSPVPTSEGRALLEKFGRELSKLSNTLLIEGHTDSRPFSGQGYSNWELSAERALTVTRTLIADGVPASSVFAAAFGAEQPVGSNASEEGRSKNRRVEIAPVPRPAANGHETPAHE